MSILSSQIKVLILHDCSLELKKMFPETALLDSNIDIIGVEFFNEYTISKLQTFHADVYLTYIENLTSLDLLSKLSLPALIILNKLDNSSNDLNQRNLDVLIKPTLFSINEVELFANSISNKIKSLYYSSKSSSISSTNIIAIGASTGGTEAILEVTKDLPTNTCAVLIVQHMPEVFSTMYAKRLNSLTNMNVREAKNFDRVVNGEILIAAGGFHLTLCRDDKGYFVHSLAGEKVCGHCPSVDVLFNSVAEVAKDKALGIILTGMGKDGAVGLLNMRKAGAFTIGQNAETCIVYGMPDAAKRINAVVKELPLQLIAFEIINYTNKN